MSKQKPLTCGYEHSEDKIFQYEGKPVIVPTTKRYPPDTQAASLWLRNRQPAKWRDKQEIEQSGEPLVIIRDYTGRIINDGSPRPADKKPASLPAPAPVLPADPDTSNETPDAEVDNPAPASTASAREPKKVETWSIQRPGRERISALLASGRPVAAPPGTPPERIQFLREAFAKALHDPELIAKAEKSGRIIRYASGEEMTRLVDEAMQMPDDIRQFLVGAVKGQL